MQETSIRKMELENEKNGLVISEAMYGTFGATESENCRIDVTIPVQYMVNGSQLHISGGHSKSNINGVFSFLIFSSMTPVLEKKRNFI